MPLSANQKKFTDDVKKTIEDYATKAMKKSFASGVTEGMSQKEMMEKISKDFGKEFAECSTDLCKIITDHILQMQLTPVLANGAGACVGVITIS